jgi:RNA polymerase sigma-54 factor
MLLAPKMEIKLGQSLVMTPQLQQAIKLLQMSNVELSLYVDEQMERNPLLELAEERPSGEAFAHDGPAEGAPAAQLSAQAPVDEVVALQDAGLKMHEVLDAEPGQIFDDADGRDAAADEGAGRLQDWSGVRGASSSFEERRFDLEGAIAEATSLRDHLVRQLEQSRLEGVQRAVGAYLIGCLDEAGYLVDDLSDVAERLGVDPDEVEAVLAQLQAFEPTGVFSRSLSECLSLQLRERDRLDPAMRTLMLNLDRLAQRDLSRLASLCGVDMADLIDMVQEIRALDPKPGLVFAHEVVETLVPDVYIARMADGSWRVELNSDTLPRVLVNQAYCAEIAGAAKGKDAKAFIDACHADANWLVKSLDQRARTILKVVSEIVVQQEGFLRHGVHHLRPLNLRTVADAIGMHESTVSRVTSNKYVATPRGVFELKYFFTSAIASSDGAVLHSAESVRHRIRKMIDEESPNAILSDDGIVEILRAADIDIARRTIVKYRESMKIPSSIQRRRQKARGWSSSAMVASDSAVRTRDIAVSGF